MERVLPEGIEASTLGTIVVVRSVFVMETTADGARTMVEIDLAHASSSVVVEAILEAVIAMADVC